MLSSNGNSSSQKFEFLRVLFVCAAAAAAAADQIGLQISSDLLKALCQLTELNQVKMRWHELNARQKIFSTKSNSRQHSLHE